MRKIEWLGYAKSFSSCIKSKNSFAIADFELRKIGLRYKGVDNLRNLWIGLET